MVVVLVGGAELSQPVDKLACDVSRHPYSANYLGKQPPTTPMERASLKRRRACAVMSIKTEPIISPPPSTHNTSTMPQLPIGNTNYHHDSDDESDTLLEEGRQKVRRVWEGFIDFAFQGNVLEIAFGLMYATHSLIHRSREITSLQTPTASPQCSQPSSRPS